MLHAGFPRTVWVLRLHLATFLGSAAQVLSQRATGATFLRLTSTASCAFRPLRTYECVLNNDPKKKDNGPLSDLKCKDDEGHNVYLWVEKKE